MLPFNKIRVVEHLFLLLKTLKCIFTKPRLKPHFSGLVLYIER